MRVHEGQVDAVLVVDRKAYSGGDRRVFASDLESGQVISMVMRDSGDICFLSENDHELFCCSSNGSIRSFLLTHDHKNAQLVCECEVGMHIGHIVAFIVLFSSTTTATSSSSSSCYSHPR